MDFSSIKAITIPEGVVTKIVSGGVTLWQAITETYKNWVKYSTEADGMTIYNGGLGCMYGFRMNSSGLVKEQAKANHCGYIPMKYGDVIRAKGSTHVISASGHYFTLYDESFNRLATNTIGDTTSASFYSSTYILQPDGRYMLTLDTGKAGQYPSSYIQNAKYFRISFSYCETEDFIVTVNEEIV